MRVYLAGAEIWGDLLLDVGVKHQLLSFYYLRTRVYRNNDVSQMLDRMRAAKEEKGYKFFLDSGAFTYRNNRNLSKIPPQAYFEQYKQFLMDFGDIFDVIAEFDVDGGTIKGVGEIGLEQVDSWTNELLAIPWLAKKVIPVYSMDRGDAWYQAWLGDVSSPYVGISSSVANPGGLIGRAHRWGKWIHGFGITSFKTLLKYLHFDSVDSSSWLQANKYGKTSVFVGNKFHTFDFKRKKERMRYKKTFYERWGLDFSRIWQDDVEETRLGSIIAWREYAEHLEREGLRSGGGRYSYMYELARAGVTLEEHPMVTMEMREKARALAHENKIE